MKRAIGEEGIGAVRSRESREIRSVIPLKIR